MTPPGSGLMSKSAQRDKAAKECVTVADIMIAGGTGFIGTRLTQALAARGFGVIHLRHQGQAKSGPPQAAVRSITYAELAAAGPDSHDAAAVVNLAGRSISKGRWTAAQKRQILDTRLRATEAVANAITRGAVRPAVLVSASAVGYYGTSPSRTFTEEDGPAAPDFLATVCSRWEQAARAVEPLGVRVVLARFGVVLGSGGALGPLVLPYRLHAGGPLGSGVQAVSWIHIDDAIALLLWLLDRADLSGPVNITAPDPVTMNELGREIAAVLHTRHWLPTPAWVLRAALGGKADMILTGQRVIPQKALRAGFTFRHPELRSALRDLLGKEEG